MTPTTSAPALEWSRQQQRHDLILRIAIRMAPFWGGSGATTESGNGPDTCSLSAHLDVDGRAGASFVAASAAQLIGDFPAMERHSADAIASSPADSWVRAHAYIQQVLYWAAVDPGRARPAAREARRLAEVLDAPLVAELASAYEDGILFYARDFQRAMTAYASRPEPRNGRSASNWAVLHALAGDLDTAESIDLTRTGSTVFPRHMRAVAEAVLAVRAGRRDDAERLITAITADVLDHGLPLADVDCLLLHALLAVEIADLEAAASLLATARAAATSPFRWEASIMLYHHLVGEVRSALDVQTAARCRAEGATRGAHEALRATPTHRTAVACRSNPARSSAIKPSTSHPSLSFVTAMRTVRSFSRPIPTDAPASSTTSTTPIQTMIAPSAAEVQGALMTLDAARVIDCGRRRPSRDQPDQVPRGDDAAQRHRPGDPGPRRARRHQRPPARQDVPRGPLRPALRRARRGPPHGRGPQPAAPLQGRRALVLTPDRDVQADVPAAADERGVGPA